MKKIIAFILSFSLMVSMSLTAFSASEPSIYNPDMVVTAHSYSSFSYYIPESLDITSNYQDFEVGISMYDLDDDLKIVFSVLNENNICRNI